MTELSEYGLADVQAFDATLRDNTPYNPEFYARYKGLLLNFVSYYESCKEHTDTITTGSPETVTANLERESTRDTNGRIGVGGQSCALSCILTAAGGVEG